jgi:hypothetical protein
MQILRFARNDKIGILSERQDWISLRMDKIGVLGDAAYFAPALAAIS